MGDCQPLHLSIQYSSIEPSIPPQCISSVLLDKLPHCLIFVDVRFRPARLFLFCITFHSTIQLIVTSYPSFTFNSKLSLLLPRLAPSHPIQFFNQPQAILSRSRPPPPFTFGQVCQNGGKIGRETRTVSMKSTRPFSDTFERRS